MHLKDINIGEKYKICSSNKHRTISYYKGYYIKKEGYSLRDDGMEITWSGHQNLDMVLLNNEPQERDVVKSPSHYQFFPDVEAIEIIASSMTEEMFRGYCIGNRLKYRLRAGNKDKLEQDIAKSDFYIELFNKHRHLCKVM